MEFKHNIINCNELNRLNIFRKHLFQTTIEVELIERSQEHFSNIKSFFESCLRNFFFEWNIPV